jgi:glycosyltransferase involved in cell wall biosynthesis
VKILLHSNGPTALTGYGIQVAQLAPRLRDAGHDVAISAYYGQQNGFGDFDGIRVYPGGHDAYSNDVLHQHALHHFDGDPLGGWILPIMDVFGMTSPLLRDFNIAAWTPVDHHPVPDAVVEFFRRTNAVPIAMSQWGQKMLQGVGLDAMYAPLTLEPVFAPTPTITHAGQAVSGRQVMGVPDEAFVVMMNGMNKGWAIPRKSYPRAFLAFGDFAKRHPEAVLYVHAHNLRGMDGDDLIALAHKSGIPEHQIRFVDQYAHQLGIPAEMLAALYTAADVLLAPSMGEGFCVPLVEAQACGTPVIVTDFSAQPELLGAGWKVGGEPWWDTSQLAWMVAPHVAGIVDALDKAHEAKASGEIAEMAEAAQEKAAQYNADRVFETCWLPILAELEGSPIELDRTPIPAVDGVAVLVPVLTRPENVAPLVDSFNETNDGANLYFVVDPDDDVEQKAIKDAGGSYLISDRGKSFAQKINSGAEQTTEPWLFVCGDDVRFRPGWLAAARKLSTRFDVIGTNDSKPDEQGNPRVAAGAHSDHFFIRRSYVDTYGGNLGPDVLCEKYRHFFTDVETIELAKARRVFTPCLESLVEHMHPDLGRAEVDDVYRAGWSEKEHDTKVWEKRAPLVVMQRRGRGK